MLKRVWLRHTTGARALIRKHGDVWFVTQERNGNVLVKSSDGENEHWVKASQVAEFQGTSATTFATSNAKAGTIRRQSRRIHNDI